MQGDKEVKRDNSIVGNESMGKSMKDERARKWDKNRAKKFERDKAFQGISWDSEADGTCKVDKNCRASKN